MDERVEWEWDADGVLKIKTTEGLIRKTHKGGEQEMVEFKTKELGKREMTARVIDADVKVGKKFGITQLHFEFEPIGIEWENQHEWYGLSDDVESAFGILTARLVSLKLMTDVQVREAKDLDTLAKVIIEAVSDKEIYWKEESTPKKKSNVWLPVTVKEAE